MTIRSYRHAKGWTLEQLADETGLSKSFISQIERGLCSLSLFSLEKICVALDAPIEDLLSTETSSNTVPNASSPVRRKGDELQVRIGSYPIHYRHLTTTMPDRKIEVWIDEVPPGKECDLVGHDGEEFGYVLSGTLILGVDDEEYILEEGDWYHFDATRLHGYGNHGDRLARVLVVSTQKFLEWYEKAMTSGVGARASSRPNGQQR